MSSKLQQKISAMVCSPLQISHLRFFSYWVLENWVVILVCLLDFGVENMIGKGGYAEVYKGCLPNGQFVAIKRLTRGTPEEITGDFLSEIGIMAHVNHPNTAKLIGYGVEGGMHLVLELSPQGSLASVLYGWSIVIFYVMVLI